MGNSIDVVDVSSIQPNIRVPIIKSFLGIKYPAYYYIDILLVFGPKVVLDFLIKKI